MKDFQPARHSVQSPDSVQFAQPRLHTERQELLVWKNWGLMNIGAVKNENTQFHI